MKCFELRMLYSSCSNGSQYLIYMFWDPRDMHVTRGVRSGVKVKVKMTMAYLSSGVDDLGGVFLTFVLDIFAKGVLNRRIVTLDEVPIHELYCE
jgi:hypothetical protein